MDDKGDSIMAHLAPILLEECSDEEVFWLAEIAKRSYYGESARDLFERAAEREFQLWRVLHKEAKGIMATKLIQRKTGKEFWIEFLVGEGWAKYTKEFWDACSTQAALADCRFIGVATVRPAIVKLMEREVGLKPVSVIFSQEV